MSELKSKLVSEGLRVLGDPRVTRIVQDPRFMAAMMTAMGMPSRARGLAKEAVGAVARTMELATTTEVRDLRRTVRALEEQVAQLRSHNS